MALLIQLHYKKSQITIKAQVHFHIFVLESSYILNTEYITLGQSSFKITVVVAALRLKTKEIYFCNF
jgi:hypothetical protein